jgi:hypothetical protein
LFLIAVHGLGERFEDVEVPINIYDIVSRGEIRGNFIRNNTTTGKQAGKKSLDIIDLIMQMIYGVEVDGVTEQEWVDAHAKWKALADAGMFMTADKFNDTEEIGAISRLNEINDSSVNVIKQFAVYGKYVVDLQKRPINTKEIPIIVEFFNLCEQQDILYTDAQIQDLAQLQYRPQKEIKQSLWQLYALGPRRLGGLGLRSRASAPPRSLAPRSRRSRSCRATRLDCSTCTATRPSGAATCSSATTRPNRARATAC